MAEKGVFYRLQDQKMCCGNMIETSRLLLCPSDEERDLELYHKHLREDGDFEQFTGLPYSEENVQLMRLRDAGYFTVMLKESLIMIGYVAYHENSCEAEFYIFKAQRRKGYGKEALTALINRIFSGDFPVKKENGAGHFDSPEAIMAETLSENTAAIRFMESCGFREKDDPTVLFKVLIREDTEESENEDTDSWLLSVRLFEIRRECVNKRIECF